MKKTIRVKMLVALTLALALAACSTPQFQTLKILDSSNRVVALQAMSEAYGGKGYDHPVSLTIEEMSRLLKGVRVQRGLLSSTPHPALSEREIQFFAPHFVRALEQATPEEIVTFFETAELEEDYQITTSGGFYIAGGNFYFILSNFSVKTTVWQDNEYYESSYRNRPLDRMDPQLGQLMYDPQEYMVQSPDGEIGSKVKGKPWQVAVRYQDFLKSQPPPIQ